MTQRHKFPGYPAQNRVVLAPLVTTKGQQTVTDYLAMNKCASARHMDSGRPYLGSRTILEKAANGDTQRGTVFFAEVVLNTKLYNSTTHFRLQNLH